MLGANKKNMTCSKNVEVDSIVNLIPIFKLLALLTLFSCTLYYCFFDSNPNPHPPPIYSYYLYLD